MKVIIRNKYGEGRDLVMPDFWKHLPDWVNGSGIFEVCLDIVEIEDCEALDEICEICDDYLRLRDQKAILEQLGKQSRESLHMQFHAETLKLSERFKEAVGKASIGNVEVNV